MKMHPFVEAVAALRFDDCFNPYSDRCEIYDHVGAPLLRAAALSSMIESALKNPVESLWIGRDLGYRGGRRTGLALTDDVHMGIHAKRWGVVAERATVGAPVAERTAAVIWSKLNTVDARIFLWNVFPLHPHEPDDQFSNRQHNSKERRAGAELLRELISLLKPARLVAIGNDAAGATRQIQSGVQVVCVRHPSYGGQNQFLREIDQLYRV